MFGLRPPRGPPQAHRSHPDCRARRILIDALHTPDIREDHASYIASWLKVLKDDKRAIFSAAGHAQRAASFLHDLQPAEPEEPAPDMIADRAAAPSGMRPA